MKVITFPINALNKYAIRLEAPKRLYEDFSQLRGLFLSMEDAKSQYKKGVVESCDAAMAAIFKYNQKMELLGAWAADELRGVLGFDYNSVFAYSGQWVVPEEYAEEMLYGYTPETPAYGIHSIAKEMDSIPYDGTLERLGEILSTLPPAWKYGKDFTISTNFVHPQPVDW